MSFASAKDKRICVIMLLNVLISNGSASEMKMAEDLCVTKIKSEIGNSHYNPRFKGILFILKRGDMN